jgi:2-polyprenyl-6-methoxyphenol hydroxylase-like FAD-dependent oxidoreductase
MAAIPAQDWDALACPEAATSRPIDPFTTHRFLAALEASGSTGHGTGWQARPLVLRDQGRVVAAIVAEAVGRASLPMPTTTTLAAAAFRATPPLTRSAPLVSGPRGQILRCGDAAGYVEPFTGEGIGWALAGARLLATALVASGDGGQIDTESAGTRYRAAHTAYFAGRHRRCRRIARGLRVGPVVSGLVHAARLAPWAARRIVPLLVGHSRPSALVRRVDHPGDGSPAP